MIRLGNMGNPVSSPGLTALARSVAEGDGAAVEAFWNDMAANGAPLIEASGTVGSALLTLVWRAGDGADGVSAVGGPGGMGLDALERLANTDVWFRTYTVPEDTRCTYQFLETPAAAPGGARNGSEAPSGVATLVDLLRRCRPDPLNPRRVRLPSNENDGSLGDDIVSSVAELPGAPAQPWVEARPAVTPGTLELHHFDSVMLGNRRRIWVHTPAGYSPEADQLGLLIAFDGGMAVTEPMSLPTTLDNLAAAGAAPPLVTVLVDNPSPIARRRELPCHAPFADFLAAELVPWVRQGWNVTADPDRTILAGASFGGVAALYAALRHPERFGNILSNSGAFWWTRPGQGTEWLIRRTLAGAGVPRRCYLDVGLFETGLATKGQPDALASNRLLREVLIGKGSKVHYHEFSGGHHPQCWRGTFADGLISLTADWQSTAPLRQAESVTI